MPSRPARPTGSCSSRSFADSLQRITPQRGGVHSLPRLPVAPMAWQSSSPARPCVSARPCLLTIPNRCLPSPCRSSRSSVPGLDPPQALRPGNKRPPSLKAAARGAPFIASRERETIHLQQPSTCSNFRTLFLFSAMLRLLVIRCQVCGTVYDRRSNQPAPGMRPVCPQNGAVPGRGTENGPHINFFGARPALAYLHQHRGAANERDIDSFSFNANSDQIFNGTPFGFTATVGSGLDRKTKN